MFEKSFDNGYKVVIDSNIIGLYRADGSRVTISNVDYYFDVNGYNCKSDEEAANKFFENFGNG